ncbi:disease resistance protein RPV1-like [Syzygium oleosum]|uniref:disease resistance protein RPV1-like n=1 Tax=Syzygium oleosum TaxID=219896 RepID=UPI0024B8F5F9|nr:disease resistance protein RPV1-like [Syzygium oleosum]
MKRKTEAFYMWESCNFFAEAEFEVLIDKSLIKIVDHDRIWMHVQLRDLGREIVRQENIRNPEGRSRLWLHEMALDIVRARKGTDNVVALALMRSRHNFTREDFADLSKTRFLELDGGNFTGDFENLFPELRWLCWHHCPSKLQVTNFVLKSLVILKLSGNIIIDEWSGWVQIMVGSKLKVLNLKGSKFLTRTPDFVGCLNLERFIIRDCENLDEINGSIEKLEQLKCLKIKWCPRLRDLPEEIGCLSSLRELILIQCQYVRNLPPWIGNLKGLSRLVMEDLGLDRLPQEISELVDLKYLSLMNCTGLQTLPYTIGQLKSLVELDLSGTLIRALPLSIENLANVVVKLNSSAIRFQLENCRERFTSYWSAQRPKSYAKIMSRGELGSSLRLSEYPIDLLIECGMIETVYDVDLQCMPSYIKQISVSTIFNAPKTRRPASKILAILYGRGIIQIPSSIGEVLNQIYSLVSLLNRMRAMNLCFVSRLLVYCMPPTNPGLRVKIASIANKRFCSRSCDHCLQMLKNLLSSSPQDLQIRKELEQLPELSFELSMTLCGSEVLACELEIVAGSFKCPFSVEELETLVTTSYISNDLGAILGENSTSELEIHGCLGIIFTRMFKRTQARIQQSLLLEILLYIDSKPFRSDRIDNYSVTSYEL